MEEKYMVNDVLNDFKGFIKEYSETISELESIDLRTTMQEIRNSLEKTEYELLKIAESKGYYIPVQLSTKEEMEKIKDELNIEN